MMENISQQPDVVYSTFHLSPDGVSKKDASTRRHGEINNLSDHFHIYVMEWDKDSIKLMVDDKLVKSIDLNTTNYANGAGNPFRTPFYLILNSAVGGNWCEKAPQDGTGYPVEFLIDYVRFTRPRNTWSRPSSLTRKPVCRRSNKPVFSYSDVRGWNSSSPLIQD